MPHDGRMAERFYTDLAEWWPIISAPEEYAEEAAEALRHLRSAQPPGARGARARERWRQQRRAHEGRARPDARRPQPGDGRGVRSASTRSAPTASVTCAPCASGGRSTPCSSTTPSTTCSPRTTSGAAMVTAFEHCRPGGVAVLIPDATTESWAPGTDHGGHDAPDGRGARYLSWSWDPDPTDGRRSPSTRSCCAAPTVGVELVHETHHNGLFPEATWLRLLADVGFDGDGRGRAHRRGAHPPDDLRGPPAGWLTELRLRTARTSGRRRGRGRPPTGPTTRGSTGGCRRARRATGWTTPHSRSTTS